MWNPLVLSLQKDLIINRKFSMTNKELSKKEHWDTIYNSNAIKNPIVWVPKNYDSLILEYIILKSINQCNPKTILEIGCGNSTWLPYLAKKTNAIVSGIDYSEAGCQLARQRLKDESIERKIFCEDIFSANPKLIGQYDFVYSLGVVEHFSNTQLILEKELQFVKPGGILFTEIPNLYNSIYTLLSLIYHPKLFAMHEKISNEQLIQAYQNLGLEGIECKYAGFFSVTLIAWGKYPRCPKLSNTFLPSLLFIIRYVDLFLSKTKFYSGFAPLAPFIYITGLKKQSLGH